MLSEAQPTMSTVKSPSKTSRMRATSTSVPATLRCTFARGSRFARIMAPRHSRARCSMLRDRMPTPIEERLWNQSCAVRSCSRQ